MTDNPWHIKKNDFPERGNLTDKIKFVLGYAILAPSTHNSQPWLFKIKDNSCEIYYDQKLKLPEADPLGRDLYISMGCMIENLIIASSYFGIFKDLELQLPWASWSDHDAHGNQLIARVLFQDGREGNKDLEYLVDTIPRRVNARGFFEPESLPEGIQAELMSLNKDGRIKLDFITDKEKIKKLASLTAEGLRLAYKKLSFRKEMSSWMHSSLSSSKTGLLGYSLRMPLPLSFLIPTLVRFFDISPLLAKLNYRSMASVPFVCVFSSEESDPSVWFEVGRLAERMMLHLQSKEIKTSIFVASIEIGDLYKKVQEILENSLTPQFLFCAGYMSARGGSASGGKNVQPHSPRQKLESVLLL